MTRIIVTYLVPFLLPLAGYSLWIWYRTIYARTHGGEAPAFEKGPWPLMLFLGAVLALLTLGVGAVLTGGDPDDEYIPARMEDGKLVPGRMEKHAPDAGQPR